jgi:hypothetical protein
MLKKHFQKKFDFEKLLTEDEIKAMDRNFDLLSLEEAATYRKPTDNLLTLALTEDSKAIRMFHYNDNGRKCFIPEPDPILIYLNSAYINYTKISAARKEILTLVKRATLNEGMINSYMNFSTANRIFAKAGLSGNFHQQITNKPQNKMRCTENAIPCLRKCLNRCATSKLKQNGAIDTILQCSFTS